MNKCYKCGKEAEESEGARIVYAEDNCKNELYRLCKLCRVNFQTICAWCTEPVFSERVFELKTFWNRTLTGYPICNDCLGKFKLGKQTTYNEDRIKLGLEPEPEVIKQKIIMEFFK